MFKVGVKATCPVRVFSANPLHPVPYLPSIRPTPLPYLGHVAVPSTPLHPHLYGYCLMANPHNCDSSLSGMSSGSVLGLGMSMWSLFWCWGWPSACPGLAMEYCCEGVIPTMLGTAPAWLKGNPYRASRPPFGMKAAM